MTAPKVTIGVVSYNRKHYLRALMESARQCIEHEQLEWIVVDGDSSEEGLQDYIRQLDFVDHKLIFPCTHVEAMNKILDMCTTDYLLLLPDDFQFIVKANWLKDLVDMVDAFPHIGSIVLDAQRRQTIDRIFSKPSWKTLLGMRNYLTYGASSGRVLLGYGDAKPGINPAGIGTFTRTEIWRKLAPWTEPGNLDRRDSSGGGEDAMLKKYLESGLELERLLLEIPVCASIHAGARNDQAYIRNNRRYAEYMPPPDGTFYYQIWQGEESRALQPAGPALSFEEIVRPIGYELLLDDAGHLLPFQKTPHDVSAPI